MAAKANEGWFEPLAELGVKDVIALDTEYVGRTADPVVPVCMCAMSLVSGKQWRVPAQPLATNPLPLEPEVLYVTFSAPAEWSYFLASGWTDLPKTIIDLYAERMLVTNTLKDARGKRVIPTLLSSLTAYGIDAMTAAEKEEMRDLILRGQPYSATEWEHILDYCMEDVVNTGKLFFAMLPKLNIAQAMMRGAFTRAVGWIEFNGIPVDVTAYRRLVNSWTELKNKLALAIEREHGYGVYVQHGGKVSWSSAGFSALIHRLGLEHEWPKTESGKYVLADPDNGSDEDKVFKTMAMRYPYLEPLRKTRKTLTTLRNFELPIGSDGRCRTHPWPWWTATGRSQPKKGFLFSLPAWARLLMKPGKKQAIAYIDLKSAEFGIAEALTGDQNMQKSYRDAVCGAESDVYIAFAKLAGAVPPDGTKESYPEERKLYKVAALASQYGQEALGFARRTGLPLRKAEEVIGKHHSVYARYWKWTGYQVLRAELTCTMSTSLGWSMPVTENTSRNQLINFPEQATCAEIMRLATSYMVDEGIALCCTVHDAVLIEAPIEQIDADVETAVRCWKRASSEILDGFNLGCDKVVVKYPDRFDKVDKEDLEMWERVQRLLYEIDAQDDALATSDSIEEVGAL